APGATTNPVRTMGRYGKVIARRSRIWMSSLAAPYIRSGGLAPPEVVDPPDVVPGRVGGAVVSFVVFALRQQTVARRGARTLRGQDSRRRRLREHCGGRRRCVAED